jgi:hypothetical protein
MSASRPNRTWIGPLSILGCSGSVGSRSGELIAPKRLLRLDLMNADPTKLGRRPSPTRRSIAHLGRPQRLGRPLRRPQPLGPLCTPYGSGKVKQTGLTTVLANERMTLTNPETGVSVTYVIAGIFRVTLTDVGDHARTIASL